MAGSPHVRRVLLVNALIFAVLAAAVALAYYGYSYTSEVSSSERELAVLQELADDKVLDIESRIESSDNKLLAGVQLEPMSDLRELVKTTGVAANSVFVLDDHLALVPDGSVSTRLGKPGIEFRDKFLARIVPKLPLARQPVGKRGHVYGTWDGRPYLFSFMKRVSGDKTFYVVIEDDLIHLVNNVFPQFFSVSASSKRLYQVRDETGALRYGAPFGDTAGEPVQETRFVSTVDGWVLRVTQKDMTAPELDRRKLIDSLLIGVAVTVIVAGLTFLGLTIRRERRLNELKSEFISNVSHELKTPLSIISMFGEMLAEGRTKSPEQAHDYAEIIWRESVRLGRLIDNVLDFAKIERGMGVYEFAEADLGEVIERASELSARRIAAADMTLEADIAPDLPVMQLDANAFTLAVLNLIDNAIKYAAAGKRIALTVRRDGDRIELTVRDWGPGIDPEEHDRIFDRFYRARAIRLAPIRGSGIGLALVQHISRAHGGDASVTSVPGQGATFHLSLPVIDA
jgi:two-component system phosphate regulon sensor histidine kinase PhoR